MNKLLRNWRRQLALIIAFVMIAINCNAFPVKAADYVYSADFEYDNGGFKGLNDATVELTHKSDAPTLAPEEDETDAALLTKKVTMKMENGGYTDAFIDLTAMLSKTSKDGLAAYETIQVVLNVDKVEALAGASAVAKLYFQPNTTWSWCTGSEVELVAGKDVTLAIPISSINWGSGDTQAGAFGIQLVNMKEGSEINATVKSVNLIDSTKLSSMAAYLKTGEAVLEYVAQYDITSYNIELGAFLSVTSKEDISKAKSLEVVLSVDKAENFTAEKTPTATLYFQPNSSWSWNVGTSMAVTAGTEIKVSIPASDIKWGAGDTAMGHFGIQLANFKEGTINYTIKSIKIVSKEDAASEEAAKEAAEIKGDTKSGSSYLYVSGRTSKMSGAYADLSGIMKPGKTYKVTAWVRNNGAELEFMRLSFSSFEQVAGTVVAAEKASQNEWVMLEATILVPTTRGGAFLKLFSTNGKNDFGIDLVQVSELSKGTTSKVQDYTVTSNDVLNGKADLQNKTYNNLTIDASVGSATVLLDNVVVAGKLSFYDGAATKIELQNSSVNKLIMLENKIVGSAIQSFEVAEYVPTILLGPGSSLVQFLAGADVELTQDEQSVLENIIVKPSEDGGIEIVLKNVKCNVVIEADNTSPINLVLENAQLSNVLVNSSGNGGQVNFNGDSNSNMQNVNLENSNGITSTINAPVTNLNINSNNTTVNVNSNVDAITLGGNQGNVTIGTGASVNTLIANGNNATVISQGPLTSVSLNGNNAKVTVPSNTKVEIKNGATGSQVVGSQQVTDNNPAAPTPTPEIEKATVNKILAKNVSKSVTIVQDPVYEDANANISLTDYFAGYTSKAILEKYERIEIKMTVDAVTNYSSDKTAKVNVYTQNSTWNWVEYEQPTLTANAEITITVPIASIGFAGESQLNAIGLKFTQFAANTAMNCSIASIKLIASDTAPDEQQSDKAEEDLVISSTAHIGSVTIADQGWSGVGSIDLTSYFTDAGKAKATVSLYDYLEIKLTVDSLAAYNSTTPTIKAYTKDGTSWSWGDGGDTAALSGTTTVRMPVTKIKWGSDGNATTIGEAGLQLYNFAVGTTINYTIQSIKLIAPESNTPGGPTIEAPFVEIVTGTYGTYGDLSLSSNISSLSKTEIMKYDKIKAVLAIEDILLVGSTPVTAKIYAQDNVNWSWAATNPVAVSANSTLTIEMNTSEIVWGSDGNSTTLGALGIQFNDGGAGTKIEYELTSVELTGLKTIEPTPYIAVSAVTGSALIVLDGSAGKASVSVKELLTSEELSKAFINQYDTIEIKVTVADIDLSLWPGGCLYVQNDVSWDWCTGSWINITSGSITYTIPTASITWGTSTTTGAIGFQFFNFPVNSTINYTIDSITYK